MTAKTTRQANKGKTGPEAETVKLKGDWRKNVKTALAKPRPKGGWPKV